jgi:hypothetical protein
MIARIAPWLLVIAFGAGAYVVVQLALHREAEAQSEMARQQEARELDADGQIRVLEVDKDALRLALAHAMNGELAIALAKTMRAAPGAKVVRTVEASTGPVPMDQEALRALCKELPREQTAPPSDIQGEGRVKEAYVRAVKGTTVVDGFVECWQNNPDRKLFSGPYVAEHTQVIELEQSKPAGELGLGLGVAAFASGKGTALGLAVSPPPLRIWALQLDLTLAAGTGQGGWHGAGTILGRMVR